jgi:hypothetical protein
MILRIAILVVLPFTMLVAQDKKTAKKADTPKQPSTALTIPAGAKQIEPYTYRYIDKDGKKWIYRQTPFGITRFEEKPSEKNVPDAADDTKVTEEGDSLRFERQTPFGTTHWVRKKTELNEVERAAWDRARNKQPGSTPGGK